MSYKLKTKNYKLNDGMSYVELIVVLAIFSIMSGVVLFNYRDFQARIEVKSLSNDVALKIVGAQKDATGGKLPVFPFVNPEKTFNETENWRPAYGIYFNIGDLGNNQAFDYFTDLNNDVICNSLDDPYYYSCNEKDADPRRDYISSIDINPKYQIASLVVYCDVVGSISENSLLAASGADIIDPVAGEDSITVDILSITFARSNPQATIWTAPEAPCQISTAIINFSLAGSNSISSSITVYSSGRIQIK